MRSNADSLKDYLDGMSRHSRLALEQLDEIDNWPELMRHEIERRAIHAIGILPDDLIFAIVNGELDIKKSIREVLTQNSSENSKDDDARTIVRDPMVAAGQ